MKLITHLEDNIWSNKFQDKLLNQLETENYNYIESCHTIGNDFRIRFAKIKSWIANRKNRNVEDTHKQQIKLAKYK